MAGLSLEVLTGPPCPRVGITVDGLDDSGPSVITVWRSTAGGRRRKVRGLDQRTVFESDYKIDFEAPLARLVTYDLQVVSGAVVPETVQATVTVDSLTGWLQDPLTPDSAVPVRGDWPGDGAGLLSDALATFTRALGAQTASVLGAAEPVAMLGQRMAASGVNFSLLTDAAEQSTALRDVLEQAGQVLVRGLPDWVGLALPDLAYVAADVVEEPLTRVGGSATRWRLQGDLVAPQGIDVLTGSWTYDDVQEIWGAYTYTAVETTAAAVSATYLDDLRDPTHGGS